MVKVAELEGALLDYWVARAEGSPLSAEWDSSVISGVLIGTGAGDLQTFAPSTDWQHGGPIIERERIQLWGCGEWMAKVNKMAGNSGVGPTPLIAAMRAYVASKFGEEVEMV